MGGGDLWSDSVRTPLLPLPLSSSSPCHRRDELPWGYDPSTWAHPLSRLSLSAGRFPRGSGFTSIQGRRGPAEWLLRAVWHTARWGDHEKRWWRERWGRGGGCLQVCQCEVHCARGSCVHIFTSLAFSCVLSFSECSSVSEEPSDNPH